MVKAHDDPWRTPVTGSDGAETTTQSASSSKTRIVMRVTPLDAQFGVWPRKTVPDTLREPLFGRIGPKDPGIARYDAANAAPPLDSYAILDAAKVQNLPDILTASGLSYRCLFKGRAESELAEVAPYLVRLSEENDLVRRLLTRSDKRADLWDIAPGIYLRSRGTLDEIWRHLRKFTRLQDEQGNWFYFRFWEPHAAQHYFEVLSVEPQRYARWFRLPENGWIDAFLIPDPQTDSLTIFKAVIPADNTNTPPRSFSLVAQELSALRHAWLDRDLSGIIALMTQTFPALLAELGQEEFNKRILRSVGRAGEFQIRQRANVFRFAAWDLHSAGTFERIDSQGRLRSVLESATGEADKMRRLGDRIAEIEQADDQSMSR